MNTQLTTATVLAAVTLSACATSPRISDHYNTFDERRSATASYEQDPRRDYSPAALLHEAHGEFLGHMERFRPAVQGRFRGLSSAAIEGEDGSFDSWQVGVDGAVPIAIDPDSTVELGGFIEGRRFKSDAGLLVGDESLYEVGAHIGYTHFMSDETYVEAMFSPGVFSDLDGNLTSDDWGWHGHLKSTHRASETVYYKFGLEASSVFKDTSLYPVAGFAWMFRPGWRLDVLAPREIELSYLPDSATTLSFGAALDGQRYHVRSPSSTNKVESDYITQELSLYLGGVHRFTDQFSMFARIGGAIAGHYEFRSVDSGGSPVNVDGKLEPTMMFEVGIGWDF